MSAALVIASITVMAGTSLWCVLGSQPDSSPAQRRRWYFGTYMTTDENRTLIITGGGPWAVTVVVTEPPEHSSTPAPAPPAPDAPGEESPSTVAGELSHTPRPRNTGDIGDEDELAELEQLWRLPALRP